MSDFKLEVGKTYVEKTGLGFKVKISHSTLLQWGEARFFAFVGYRLDENDVQSHRSFVYTENGAGISGLDFDGFMNPVDLAEIEE